MNYVAALLLLVMKTEEDAFWMLSVLLENVLFSESFSEDLRGCHLAQRVFKDLLKKKFPRFAAALRLPANVSCKAVDFICLEHLAGFCACCSTSQVVY